jgi:2-(1,2-epoxy-1,2-dihydrophenyl)acetyl-CoA isomerase
VVQAELQPAALRLLAFGNELHDAHACLRLGVFDEVVEPDAVLSRAQEIARELAAMPAEVYARTKQDLRGATIERLRAAAAADPLLARWV